FDGENNKDGTKELIAFIAEDPSGYPEEFQLVVAGTVEWLKTKVTKDTVSNVLPELNALLDDTVCDILGGSLFEQTGEDLNTEGAQFKKPKGPPDPIWVQLLSDLCKGNIDKMAHTSHYNTTFGHGAEFAADSPNEKKDKYLGEAVLHTHYDVNDRLVKAHAKPYSRRFDTGYGKYNVSVGKLTGIDDTNKDWTEINDM
ncbi:MAG: hypothetical protein GY950_17740, partial [bacterium]|nr:hypothetical protein [bacterium]